MTQILEALQAPRSPQRCRACRVTVPDFATWFWGDCTEAPESNYDGITWNPGHDVPGYLKLPHEEVKL